MAKLPDGWVLVPKMKDALTVTIEQKELVCCRNCKHCYYASNRTPEEQSYVCDKIGMDVKPSWFCADGERR